MPNDAEAKDAIYNIDGATIENSEISVKQAESRGNKRYPRYGDSY